MYLWIRNLPLSLCKRDVTLLLERFGPVENIRFNSGTGAVTVQMDRDCGERALAALNRSELGGCTILAQEIGERQAQFSYSPGAPSIQGC